MLVISVSSGGHHGNGASQNESACDSGSEYDNPPMISVPLKVLATDTENGKAETPEEGDEVDIPNVRGRVWKVEGEEAYVEILSVDGEPVEYEQKQNEVPGEKEPMDEGERLKQMAMKHDAEMES